MSLGRVGAPFLPIDRLRVIRVVALAPLPAALGTRHTCVSGEGRPDPCGFGVVLATPVILSNTLVAKALSELLGG